MQSPFSTNNDYEPTYFYVTSKNIYLTIRGETFTDDMFNEYDHEEMLWKESQPNHTFSQLMQIYPEAIAPARKGLQAKIKEYKSFIKDLNESQEIYFNKIINPAPFKEQPRLIKEANESFDKRRDEWERKIKTCAFCLSHLDEMEGTVPAKMPGGISVGDIERAKEVAIGGLLKVNKGGFATCPFHKDATPSLKVYPGNRGFYCFSCNAGGSVVDLVMKMHGKSFTDSVKFLLR
jgi:hypothetical protein